MEIENKGAEMQEWEQILLNDADARQAERRGEKVSKLEVLTGTSAAPYVKRVIERPFEIGAHAVEFRYSLIRNSFDARVLEVVPSEIEGYRHSERFVKVVENAVPVRELTDESALTTAQQILKAI